MRRHFEWTYRLRFTLRQRAVLRSAFSMNSGVALVSNCDETARFLFTYCERGSFMERVAQQSSSNSKRFHLNIINNLTGYIAAALLLISFAGTAHAAVYIGGSPKTSIAVPNTYSFKPWVSAPTNSTLKFSISGKPYWATFNTTNGTLSGKVYAPNVGAYANIKISVSDGKSTAYMGAFAISVTATDTGSGTGGGGGTTAATLQLSAPSYTVAQTAGALTVKVNRTAGSSGAASANFSTANGTAVAGTDFTPVSGTLQWANGETATKSFSVPVKAAVPFSGSKTFTVALSNPSPGATVGTPGSASVAIAGTGGTTTGSGGPGAVSNLQLVNQGGTSNDSTPASNIQQISWSAAAAGSNPISYYRIYRNGVAYDTTTALTYTDKNATNAVDPTWSKAATIYSYNVSAVDTAGKEGSKASQFSVYAYQNGKSNWGNNDLSYGSISENYSSTAGSPQGGAYDIFVNFINGGFQPAVHPPQAPLWTLELGAFNYVTIDVNPGATVSTNLKFGTVTRVPPGDVYGWHPSVNVYDYGPAPKANTWATYKIPLSAIAMGAAQFTGSISGNTLTVTGIVSGQPIVDAGGFVTGPGVPSGTYVVAYSQMAATGKFTLAGPGINGSLKVGSTTMTFQRTSLYKFGLSTDTAGAKMYFNNIGFLAN